MTKPKSLELADTLERMSLSTVWDKQAAAELRRLHEVNQALVEALEAADGFIHNGIKLGFIRMPDADCPDPAHKVHGLVRAALAKAKESE